jgi:hypothetical protein
LQDGVGILVPGRPLQHRIEKYIHFEEEKGPQLDPGKKKGIAAACGGKSGCS